MSKIKLGVNIDHIAFIKKSRDTTYPDLREAVSICESSGADSITIHLREDRRHIQDQDAILIRKNADCYLFFSYKKKTNNNLFSYKKKTK